MCVRVRTKHKQSAEKAQRKEVIQPAWRKGGREGRGSGKFQRI